MFRPDGNQRSRIGGHRVTDETADSNQADPKSSPDRPTLFFKTITFSDRTTLALDEGDIVVFVGPNNAGKSAALRELDNWLRTETGGQVISSVAIQRSGSAEELQAYLDQNAHKSGSSSDRRYGGVGYNISQQQIRNHQHPHFWRQVASFFAMRISTENRLAASNAAQGIALHQAPPTHPIHLLLMDETLAAEVSEKFRHAFGEALTPFRAGGNSLPLYVGKKPELKPGEDELSRGFVEELQRTNVKLDEQGDGMRSFAAVILQVLVAKTQSILLLDEPEAFLHPPQARLLGKYLAERRDEKSQLFIATHSIDILDGLMEGGSDKLRIVRLRRDGKVNHVTELAKDKVQAVAKDTLARFSRVFEGIFFQHVIVCESDADCMFYQSLLSLPAISGDRRPDVLFIHAAGKHRMGKLAETLRALDVPVSVIADIDVLSEENTIKSLVEKLGGDWRTISPQWKAVSDSVIRQNPPLSADKVRKRIEAEIANVAGAEKFPPEKEQAIKKIFKEASPWGRLKQSGRTALPSGEVTRNFNQLLKNCAVIGLWIVPVGELEGFCRSVGSHGPGFVEKILEEKSLETDEELEDAREFVRKLWSQVQKSPAFVTNRGSSPRS